ncbi:MAG: AAA family ATPase, partial [Deltaproteobacteria bacterium]|nr:AAA family ATPase [Deltaproteobacteria bacterium]
MKILHLNLIAFGPFAGKQLDFGRGEGLHVVYGPNEAGKSTALRALRQMLFGFPTRSPDNFLHPYHKMRIGGALEHSDGTVARFVRRKGRISTLRDGNDVAQLDETVLDKFLGNVDADLFSTMFGIGHKDLVQGGEQIIRGGGNVGQALFAAGSGISDLRNVQMDLQAEAEALFAPNASKRPINEAIAELRANRKNIREAQLPGQSWQRHDEALRHAEALRNEAAEKLSRKQSEVNRLERITESLPLIGRRTELLQQLSEYEAAVLLPENFSERRVELLNELRFAEKDRDLAVSRLDEVAEARAGLEISEPVLENAGLIEQLTMDLGSYQKASGDRIQLRVKRDLLRGEAREILSGLRDDLTLETAESLRLKKTEIVGMRELGARYERLTTRRESSRIEVPKITCRVERTRDRLKAVDAPVDMNDLGHAVAKAEKIGVFEDHCRSELEEIGVARHELDLALKRQSLWSGSLEALEKTPLPAIETIDAYGDRFERAEKNMAELRYRMNESTDLLIGIEGQIKELTLEREVPTEADLQEARRHREVGWELVRRAFENDEGGLEDTKRYVAAFETAENLFDSYELSVSRADETADRLRREADRVAKMAKLLSDSETSKTRMARLKGRIEDAERELAATRKAWAEVWEPTGVSPRSPREMGGWVRDQEALLDQFSKLNEKAAKATALGSEIQAHRRAMDGCLRAVSEPGADENETLADLIQRGRKALDAQEKLGAKRETLGADLERLAQESREARARVADIEDDLSQWRAQWADAIRPLGLGEDSVPEQANAVIDELKTLFDKLREAEILKKRIQGIDGDAEALSNKASRLAERAAPESAGLPVDQIVTELSARLTRSRSAKSTCDRLDKQQAQEKEKRRDAEERIAGLVSKLNAMCGDAGCSQYGELAEAERRSAKRRALESDLGDLDERLLKLSAGATVEDFICETRTVEPDGIGGRLRELGEEIGALENEKTRLDQTIGEEKNELSKMDGSAGAAELAEESQRILARLEADAARYARLRLAWAVLTQAIERYRETHQGPVLKRTSELFADLTRGAFEGVRVEFDDQGSPVLAGVRPGG